MNDRLTYTEIGERLRKIREGYSDLKQAPWAEKHGFGITQYNNWEKGVRRISVDEAERLADMYGTTLDYIYRGKLDGSSENFLKTI